MHTTDLHATLLALMGLDHEQLTYRYAGRDFRLTDVAGQRGRGDLRLNGTGPDYREHPGLVRPDEVADPDGQTRPGRVRPVEGDPRLRPEPEAMPVPPGPAPLLHAAGRSSPRRSRPRLSRTSSKAIGTRNFKTPRVWGERD